MMSTQTSKIRDALAKRATKPKAEPKQEEVQPSPEPTPEAKPKKKWQRHRWAERKTGRLPDGSSIEAFYVNDVDGWKGKLIVPNGEDELVFELGRNGLFPTLVRLDQAYRAWLRENPSTAKGLPCE